ncbi:hypothetical protein BDQ12DRAFT_765686 [Crucibulum laeve]|uniref:Uncharacterized protein n=1 Tax=Crucibulum laeve TaxID=68775 RepID=A0A5C3LM78_9AGAR|nr:hypothetical protein BDQ12DRAFT_765686 [Crucibulum laeve]
MVSLFILPLILIAILFIRGEFYNKLGANYIRTIIFIRKIGFNGIHHFNKSCGYDFIYLKTCEYQKYNEKQLIHLLKLYPFHLGAPPNSSWKDCFKTKKTLLNIKVDSPNVISCNYRLRLSMERNSWEVEILPKLLEDFLHSTFATSIHYSTGPFNAP